MSRHVVAAARDIPPGTRKLVTIKGRPIAIFNLGGDFFGMFNRCPHQGGSLCEGAVTGLVESTAPGRYSYSRRGEIIRCPWHGWEFDIRTGKSYCDPLRTRVKSFDIRVEDGAEVVDQLLQAETFAVSVEKQYIVVEI